MIATSNLLEALLHAMIAEGQRQMHLPMLEACVYNTNMLYCTFNSRQVARHFQTTHIMHTRCFLTVPCSATVVLQHQSPFISMRFHRVRFTGISKSMRHTRAPVSCGGWFQRSPGRRCEVTFLHGICSATLWLLLAMHSFRYHAYLLLQFYPHKLTTGLIPVHVTIHKEVRQLFVACNACVTYVMSDDICIHVALQVPGAMLFSNAAATAVLLLLLLRQLVAHQQRQWLMAVLVASVCGRHRTMLCLIIHASCSPRAQAVMFTLCEAPRQRWCKEAHIRNTKKVVFINAAKHANSPPFQEPFAL